MPTSLQVVCDEKIEINTMKIYAILILIFLLPNTLVAGERETRAYFKEVRNEPTLLRNFLYKFPKGGDLHNHLDGAIYAESYIGWAAEDGKCIDLTNFMVLPPPCDAENNRPALRDIGNNSTILNPIIDALSARNYERREVSGHDQFFSTFRRFFLAGLGHEGHMLAEVSARAARQNIVYLELMQSYGMAEARDIAVDNKDFALTLPLSEVVKNKDIEKLAVNTIAELDRIEAQWRERLACNTAAADPGCDVPIRYLAQVIRVFPREQVLAQTLLAFKLIEKDPRYVGLNFVAPEDHPVALRDYHWQMETIGGLAQFFPSAKRGITLHAGEVAMGLVPPEDLGWHIRDAIDVAGARRIGHGIDVSYDKDAPLLLQRMAKEGIMVEINLTSNDVILGVKDDEHPFNAYRKYKVPMALSTDDEGVSRIDLTHEYQRAVETYDLSYEDLKYYSRNALTYSFLAGESLIDYSRRNAYVSQCASSKPGKEAASASCSRYLQDNEKARWQWLLEERFRDFENSH
ncbi:MAG: adenosine deaminase [Planctomycetota bacterium]|jgi:adenosine deaminase